MPFVIHEYPKWAEHTVRIMRIAAYAFACLTGLAVIILAPSKFTPDLYVIVSSMAVFGLICTVAAILKMYVLEWVSLFFLTAGILIYVATVWALVFVNIQYLASASIFMVLVLFMCIRLVDLTVFWLRNVRATKLQKELSDHDA